MFIIKDNNIGGIYIFLKHSSKVGCGLCSHKKIGTISQPSFFLQNDAKLGASLTVVLMHYIWPPYKTYQILPPPQKNYFTILPHHKDFCRHHRIILSMANTVAPPGLLRLPSLQTILLLGLVRFAVFNKKSNYFYSANFAIWQPLQQVGGKMSI